MHRFAQAPTLAFVLASLVVALLCSPWAPAAHAAITPAHAVGNYALDLDGTQVAWLKSVEGGSAVLPVLTQQVGGKLDKQLGKPAYEPLRIELDLSVETLLTAWVGEMLAGRAGRKSGSITRYDQNYKAVERMRFTDATLLSVAFSKLDASEGKGAMLLKLVLSPDRTVTEPMNGEPPASTSARGATLLASNFKTELDGVNGQGVVSVDGLEVTRTAASATPTFSNLTLKVSASHATDFVAWHEQGVKGQPTEKNLRIILLDPALTKEVGRLTFSGVGSSRFARERAEANKDTSLAYAAELYVESMRFTLGTPTAQPATTKAAATAPVLAPATTTRTLAR